MLSEHLRIFLSLCYCLGCLYCLSFVYISHLYCVIRRVMIWEVELLLLSLTYKSKRTRTATDAQCNTHTRKHTHTHTHTHHTQACFNTHAHTHHTHAWHHACTVHTNTHYILTRFESLISVKHTFATDIVKSGNHLICPPNTLSAV